MELARQPMRAAMSIVVTRADGTVEERVVGYADADPEMERAVLERIARGEHINELELIPHGEMTPIGGISFSGQAVGE